MQSEIKVDILLSTFNGSSYLRDQLDSIIAQTFSCYRVLIRDDGSSDGTCELLRNYSAIHTEIEIVEYGTNLGVTKSFAKLLSYSDAEIIIFCDQDDVWKPEKLAKFISVFQEEEKRSGVASPCLIVSEMECIDGSGDKINRLFSDIHSINLAHSEFSRLLLQNVVTGAACGFNKSLLTIAQEGCEEAYLHDWWFALAAAAFGKIIVIDQPLVDYRIHENNVVGASSVNLERVQRIGSLVRLRTKIDEVFRRSLTQAEKFERIHKLRLSENQAKLINEYIRVNEKSFIQRRRWMFKNKIRFSSFWRNLAAFILWK